MGDIPVEAGEAALAAPGKRERRPTEPGRRFEKLPISAATITGTGRRRKERPTPAEVRLANAWLSPRSPR
jgi:hypothetical protein